MRKRETVHPAETIGHEYGEGEERKHNHTGKQFSMGLSHFYMSCKQKHWLPSFQTIFLKMVIQQTNLEEKDSVSIWNEGQVLLLSNII